MNIAACSTPDAPRTAASPTTRQLVTSSTDWAFDNYVDDRSYQFTSALLGDLLCNICGEDSFEKRTPRIRLDLSHDGSGFLSRFSPVTETTDVLLTVTTSSDQLRDDVLRLCAHPD